MFSAKKYKSQDIQALLESLRPSLMNIFLFSAVLNLLMLTPPIFMMQIFDKVVSSKSLETLAMLLLIMIWMFFIMWLMEFVRSRMMGRVCAQMEIKLSDRLYTSVFKHAADSGEQASSQPLTDLYQVRQFLTGHTFFALLDAPWVIFFLILLFLFNVWYGVFALVMMAVYGLIAFANHRFTRPATEDSNRYALESAFILNAQIQNPEVAQSMGLYQNLKTKWRPKNQGFNQAQEQLNDQVSIWGNISKTLRLASMALMSSLGALLIVEGEITAGMLIAGGLLLSRSIMPIDAIINSWKPLDDFKDSVARIDALLADYPAEKQKTSLPEPKARLSVERLQLIPPKAEKPVLKNIHFQMQAGEVLGIVGPSASGKSSLARALTGLWNPTEGHVRLDGADLVNWNPEELGRYIGYLPQETALFEGTVIENVSRFQPNADAAVVAAAKLTGVHEMILQLPQGYDTQVGNLGVALSGGQRQRIALARAFFGLPKLVVLDEPNASLDAQGELALMRAVVNMKVAGAMVVVITHRPKVLEVTDRVLAIAEGQMVALAPFADIKEKVAF